MAEGAGGIEFNNYLDNFDKAIVACDANGRIFIFNMAAALLTEISPEKALGRSVEEVLPQSGLLEILHSQERKSSQEMLINDNLVIGNRFPIHDSSGNCLGAVVIFEDPNKAEDKPTFRLADEMESIIESSYDGIWITDGEGTVLYTNSANERISGFKREDVIGKSTQELLERKLFSNSVTLQVINLKKRVTSMGYNYLTKKQVLITGNPIFDEQGNLVRVVNNVRDITELINLKQELEVKEKLIDQQKIELEHLRSQQMNRNYDVVAYSPKMRHTFEMALRLGKFDSTVLILGESGSGKEVIAKTIVRESERREGPFIKVNCGAIPENLLESELFGYEKGAFTGANQKGKMGMFEMANKGTIFLDEIGDIPLSLQVKLLRVLQEREIMRLGGTKTIKLDVRIIAATNKNIEELVRQGKFREDLYYRLCVVSLTVPPLRERVEDIPVLATHFLQQFNEKYKVNKIILPGVVDLFLGYSWPGNVRELENLVENLVVLTPDREIKQEHLPAKIRQELEASTPQVEVKGILPLKEAVRLVEEDLIAKAMEKYGTTRKAAAILGVDQSTLVRKNQKLNALKDQGD